MAITLGNYTFRKRLEGSSPSATNIGQILLITEANVDANFWTNVANSGGAIRVCEDSEGLLQLPLDVILCNTVTQTLIAFTRKPSYSAADRNVWLFSADNADTQPVASSTFGSENVWQDTLLSTIDGSSDLSSNLSLTAVNSPTTTTGVYGGAALQLNGANQYITAPISITGNEITLSCWAKVDDLTRDNRLLSIYDSAGGTIGEIFLAWMDTGGAGDGWAALVRNTSNTNATVIGTDDSNAALAWQHITVKLSNTIIEIYVDGVLSDSLPPETNDLPNVDTIRIGRLWDRTGDTSYYDGAISDISVWEGDFTENAQLQQLNQNNPATFWTQFTSDDPSTSGSLDLLVNSVLDSQSVSSPSLLQDYLLVIQNLSVSSSLTNVELSSSQDLTLDSLSESTSISDTTLTQAQVLDIQSLTSNSTLEEATLTLAGVLSSDNLLSESLIGNTELNQKASLIADSLSQFSVIDNVTLGQAQQVLLDNLSQGTLTTNLELTVGDILGVDSLDLQSNLGNLDLTQRGVLLTDPLSNSQRLSFVFFGIAPDLEKYTITFSKAADKITYNIDLIKIKFGE